MRLMIPTLALMLCACGTNSGVGEGSGQSSAEASTTSAGPRGDETSRTDLSQEKLLSWFDDQASDERKVRVSFVMGNPQCYGVRTLLEETDSQVKIAVLEGSLPNAPAACAAVGMRGSVSVTLGQPLNGREIVPLNPSSDALQ